MTYDPSRPLFGSVAAEMNASGYPYQYYLPGEFNEEMVFRWLHEGKRVVGVINYWPWDHSRNVLTMAQYRPDFIELYVTEKK
jgi:hypothetical protein